MPSVPRKPCPEPGCRTLTSGGLCPQHLKLRRKQADQRRDPDVRALYDGRWEKYREQFLRLHPLCACPDCDSGRKRAIAATVVDHIEPHHGDDKRFWDPANHQAMAKRCHDRKTAREDGGFGNPRAGG